MSHRAAPANCRLGSLRLRRIAVPLVLTVAGLAAVVQCASPSPATGNAVYFHTLPPGAALPSGAYCAGLVNSSPQPEDKSVNKPYNSRKGRPVSAKFLA